MENHFLGWLIISIFIHIVLLVLVFRFINQNTLNFKRQESKVIITVLNNQNINITKNKWKSSNETVSVKENNFQNNLEKLYIPLESTSLVEKQKKYSYKSQKISNKQFTQDSPIGLSETDFIDDNIETEISSLENQPIQFEKGKVRKLLNSNLGELADLEIEFATDCKLEIHINSDGYIVHSEFLVSTGALQNDLKIQELVKQWIFETSDLPEQKAIIILKYYIKGIH
ncbi:MAG: hypothetical protein MJB14_00965 [Spirochaetes bacterium]|nr:hypothetical protein [Spirochaetota bacterium]